MLCLWLIGMMGLSVLWWYSQALPIAKSPFQTDYLFYGTVDRATQSPLFGRITFRINGDDGANFQLWIDTQNRAKFDLWFGPDVPLQIEARRSFDNNWLVTSLGSPYGHLDIDLLAKQRIRMGIIMGVGGTLSLLGLFWLVHQYLTFFRFKPWWGRRR